MLNKLKESLETLLKISDGDLFKDIGGFCLGIQLGKNPTTVPKKKEKLKVLIVKSTFLRIISPCILSPRIGPNGSQLDVRQDDECQVKPS